MALFSRGSHHKPKKREIPFSNRRYWHYFPEKPFSNEVPITSPEKETEIPFSNRRSWHYFPEVAITSPKKGKSRFQIEDIGIIFQKSPKRHGNPVFKWGSHHKPRKNTEIPFSNRRYWHYFPEVPITSQIKQRKSRFQREDIGIIFQRFPSQAQKKEIPFSNRRYWRYFPEKPKKTRKSRFQMRFPSQAQKKTRKSCFQIEDIGIIFQKSPKRHGNPVFKWGSHHKPRKNTEILFSNRRYWYYFPEVAITSQKNKRKSRFQIEAIGIIFQRFPSQAQKREIPFSNRRYWHYFPEKPKKTRKSRFQMRFPSQAQKKHGNSVFK